MYHVILLSAFGAAVAALVFVLLIRAIIRWLNRH